MERFEHINHSRTSLILSSLKNKKFILNSKIVIILFFVIALTGCTKMVQPLCRHNAVYQAITFKDLTGCETRIALGPSKLSKNYHAQAQVLIDGEWKWITQNPTQMGTGEKDWWFTPKKFVKVDEALKWSNYQ